jgi:hypothetical protein
MLFNLRDITIFANLYPKVYYFLVKSCLVFRKFTNKGIIYRVIQKFGAKSFGQLVVWSTTLQCLLYFSYPYLNITLWSLILTPYPSPDEDSNISCRIFEHLAIPPDPVTEFLKLGSALHSKVPFWRQNKRICFPLKIS